MKTRTQEKPLAAEGSQEAVGARLGRLLAVDGTGQAWLDFGDGARALPAALAVVATQAELEAVMANRTQVIVVADEAGTRVVGIVGKAAAAGKALQADLDGARVQLKADKEVVIACGKASITLRANGRVIIRGTQIESYSEGTNRIKGGQVRIN